MVARGVWRLWWRAAVGFGVRPATPVQGERDLNHFAQVGCVLSWLVRDERALLAGGASCHGVWGERSGLVAASSAGEAGEAA